MTQPLADIGLIGLAVMGENFALNMESKGFRVAVYNRTVERVEQFIAGRARGKNFIGARTPAELVAALQRPRKIMMLIKAGPAVDAVIDELLPLLDPGDILIDGGNSLFTDTIRRTRQVEGAGMLYVGSGISGGEEGALTGPSLMPGGSAAAWPHIKPIFQAACARTPEGEPCCDWMGEDGAGHFVKMVHNGIEYGDMQLIAETYDVMKRVLGMSNRQMHEVFAEWNAGELDSYLIEITRDILAYKSSEGEHVVDVILDAAGQKGTGKWTVIEALAGGRAADADRRSRVRACAVSDERGACRGIEAAALRRQRIHGRSRRARRRSAAGALCIEDHQLRAGLSVVARGGADVQVESELRRHRARVARRLHHPLGVPRRHQEGVRSRARPRQPAAGSVLPGRGHEPPGRVASRDRRCRAERRAGAVSQLGACRISMAIVRSGCRRT